MVAQTENSTITAVGRMKERKLCRWLTLMLPCMCELPLPKIFMAQS